MSPRTIEVPVRAWLPWDTKLRLALVRLLTPVTPALARRVAMGRWKVKIHVGSSVSVEYFEVEVQP